MAERTKMGRKKTDPPDQPNRIHAVVVKGTPEWKKWVEDTAEFFRINVSSLVDTSIAEYARTHGFDVPPPNR